LINNGKLLLNHSPLAWGILNRPHPVHFVPTGVILEFLRAEELQNVVWVKRAVGQALASADLVTF
jgi:hypothetical protein